MITTGRSITNACKDKGSEWQLSTEHEPQCYGIVKEGLLGRLALTANTKDVAYDYPCFKV